jgi:hypothetical protein
MTEDMRYKEAIDWGIDHGYKIALNDIVNIFIVSEYNGRNPEKLKKALCELNEVISMRTK